MQTFNMNDIQAGLEKKLNQKELALFRAILADLKRAEKYIQRPDVAVGRLNPHPYGTSYINKQGEGFDPMNKEVGTDLCYLSNAIRRLGQMLDKPITA